MTDERLDLRLATAADANEVAQLLHDFNTEFDTPSPGPGVLAPRLRRLLAGDVTFAVLAARPAVAFALVTVRPNVWYDGPVALLDELYVAPAHRNGGIGSAVIRFVEAEARRRRVSSIEINVDADDLDAQRFYERHGWSGYDDATGERAFFYAKEFAP